MPQLEQTIPNLSTKQLIRKAQRNRRVIELDQVSMIGQSIVQLRRVQATIMQNVETADPSSLPGLTNALCKCIEQRRILLRIPGPPTGGSTKTATPAPINAQILDAEPIEPIEHVSTENPPLAAD